MSIPRHKDQRPPRSEFDEIIDKLDNAIDNADVWNTNTYRSKSNAQTERQLRKDRNLAREEAWNKGSVSDLFRDNSPFDEKIERYKKYLETGEARYLREQEEDRYREIGGSVGSSSVSSTESSTSSNTGRGGYINYPFAPNWGSGMSRASTVNRKLKRILKMSGRSLPLIPIIIALTVGWNLLFSDDEKETMKTKVSTIYEEVKETVKEEMEGDWEDKVIDTAKKEFEKTKTEDKSNDPYNEDDKYGEIEDRW